MRRKGHAILGDVIANGLKGDPHKSLSLKMHSPFTLDNSPPLGVDFPICFLCPHMTFVALLALKCRFGTPLAK